MKGAEKQIENLKQEDGAAKLYKMMAGVRFEETIDLGIFLTGKSPPKGIEGSWCLLQVEMVDDF